MPASSHRPRRWPPPPPLSLPPFLTVDSAAGVGFAPSCFHCLMPAPPPLGPDRWPSTLCPFCSLLCGRRYYSITAALPPSMWSTHKEVTARRPRTLPKNDFFEEYRFWCFQGFWERKDRSL